MERNRLCGVLEVLRWWHPNPVCDLHTGGSSRRIKYLDGGRHAVPTASSHRTAILQHCRLSSQVVRRHMEQGNFYFKLVWRIMERNIWLDFSMQCSQECGGGFKTRKVRCQQLLALGEIANKPVGHCSKDRPSTEKKCNPQECPPGEYKQIKLLLKGLLHQAFLLTTLLSIEV